MMVSRSKEMLKRPEGAFQRTLLKAAGYSDYDLARPLIGIANSWNSIVPGHVNLNLVSDYSNNSASIEYTIWWFAVN